MDLIKHKVNQPVLPTIICDFPLHNKLNNHPLLQYMNKSCFVLILGRPGSGKSSFYTALLTNKKMWKGVFEIIILVCPPSSRDSIRNKDFESLPEDRLYDDLTLPILEEIQDRIKENRRNEFKTLVVFDDVQRSLKGQCEKLLLKMISNRRHDFATYMIIAQTYKCIPKPIRSSATDLFCFNLSFQDFNEVNEELMQLDADKFKLLIKNYRIFLKMHGKPFIYFNTANMKTFFNWEYEVEWKDSTEIK